jgi:hypothetical protein
MKRDGDALKPCSNMDAEALREFASGKTVRVRVTQPRNVGQHRLYWAALKLVHDNLDDPPSIDKLHEAVKVRLGYCSVIRFKDGSEVTMADSIAFDAMPQDVFKGFFDAFKRLVTEVIIPGMDSDTLEAEAKALLS